MASVIIGHEFFAKEARNYRNMTFAFWRELFQNSVDAGARTISVNVTDEDNGVRVEFVDNGRGMSKKTLEDIFFSLGNTTKSTGTIGGYGKARIILCFAQNEYSIRTQNLYVVGRAGEYEIDDSQSYFDGCKFSILVNPNLFYGGVNKSSLLIALNRFLSLCQIGIQININGDVYNSDWMYKRNAVRKLSFGYIYHNKSKNHPNAVVRVAGVAMFENYIGGDFGQVVVELDPDKSRDVLTSNRDGLTYESNEEFMKFIAEITVDKKKALRNRQIEKKSYHGAARRYHRKTLRNPVMPSTSSGGGILINGIRMGYGNAAVVATEGSGYTTNVSGAYVAPKPSIDPLIAGMVLLNRATDETILKAMSFYDPVNWTKDSATRRKQVLNQWIIAVESAMDTLCLQQNIDSVDYRIGWYFDNEDLACHQEQDDGSHALLLNPVHTQGTKLGKMKYSIRSMESHVELVSYACHEVAHIIYNEHDAGFARVYTHLVTETMKNMSEIHKTMMSILGKEGKYND